jgi:hypothetical protein
MTIYYFYPSRRVHCACVVMRCKDDISYNSYTYPSSLTTSKTEVIIVNFRIGDIWVRSFRYPGLFTETIVSLADRLSSWKPRASKVLLIVDDILNFEGMSPAVVQLVWFGYFCAITPLRRRLCFASLKNGDGLPAVCYLYLFATKTQSVFSVSNYSWTIIDSINIAMFTTAPSALHQCLSLT